MATLLLSQTFIDENKEFSDILNTVDTKNNDAKILLHSQSIADKYKVVSEVLNTVEKSKRTRKKTMKELMQQSFFHGSNWIGSNFIA